MSQAISFQAKNTSQQLSKFFGEPAEKELSDAEKAKTAV